MIGLIAGFLRTVSLLTSSDAAGRTARADDEMRQFLLGTLEYLNSIAGGNVEVPTTIIRAINDVERLAQIEESALPKIDQAMFRFCLLRIAHLAGDNG